MKAFPILLLLLLPFSLWAQKPSAERGTFYKSAQDASKLKLFDNHDFSYNYDGGGEDQKMQMFNTGLYEGYWEMNHDTLSLNLDLGISRGKKLKFIFAQYLKSGNTLKLIYYSERFDPRNKVELFEEE
jgi:hypothetical protein